MDFTTYSVEAEVEETHWWFVGRRHLFSREIRRLGVSQNARVLDIGTSTGTNLRMLRDLGFHSFCGLDSSDQAIAFCTEKGLGPVQKGDICALPFADSEFDLILATDIIEHVDDDVRALKEVARVLAADGHVIVTVPAFQSLWGQHDERASHYRRYTLNELITRIEDASLTPVKHYYFNYLLFVPIWLARRIISLFAIKLDSENNLTTPVLNRILGMIFSFDVNTAPVIRPPFGASALAIARKTAS